ncbi:MAG: CoA transferase [Proteobacteria bacterium]|nr:CoA transferase [Pseudomonadota bacterium]
MRSEKNAGGSGGDPGALPLAGLRVLDLSRALAGPFCAMILADMGADVIKVEPTPKGDMIRGWGPFDQGISVYYLSANRNKRGMALDFRHPDARQLLFDLAARSDVLVENFKPGTMEDMGLHYAYLAKANPRLIYASITGFGRGGPAGDWPGFDQIAQGYSGLMSLTGMPEAGPTRVGVAIGDLTSGMWSAIGVLGAVIARHVSGRGQRVETSLLASLVGLLSVQGQRYLSLGEVPVLAGNAHPVIVPYGAFETADGPLNIAPATPEMWQRLCELLELAQLPSDQRFIDNAARTRNREELKALLEAKLKLATRAEWTAKMLALGIPAGPINNLSDVFADAQVAHLRLVEEVTHPLLGALKQIANPVRMDSLAGRSVRTAPPQLGEHTREALRDYGFTDAQVEQWLQQALVFQAKQS